MSELAGPDRRLFKYYSQDAARAVLENRTLRWSRPTAFNDIFDAQVDYDLSYDVERVIDLATRRLREVLASPADYEPNNALGNLLKVAAPTLRELGEEAFATFEEGIREAAENKAAVNRFSTDFGTLLRLSKILCLSDDPLSRPLWGHYGDSFKGAVFEFRTIPELDSPYRIARKVEYVSEPPRVFTEEDYALVFTGESDLSGLAKLDQFVCIKHVDWSWEKEWRLVSGLGRHPDEEIEYVGFDEKELAAVLIGPRAEPGFKQHIRDVIDARYPYTAIEAVAQRMNFELHREVLVKPVVAI